MEYVSYIVGNEFLLGMRLHSFPAPLVELYTLTYLRCARPSVLVSGSVARDLALWTGECN